MMSPSEVLEGLLVRTLLLALLLPLLASPALAAKAEPQEVVLRFQPQPGDKLRQTVGVNMQMAMNMLPGPDTSEEQRAKLQEGAKRLGKGMSMDMKMAMRVEASEADAKGDYLLHLRGEGGQMTVHAGDQPPKAVPNPVGDLELDTLTNVDRNKMEILRVKSTLPGFRDSKALEVLGQGLIKQAFGAMSGLEGRRMRIGESAEIPFDVQMPMAQLPANAHIVATLGFTLKSIRGGIANFDTVVKMKMDMASNEGEAQQMTMAMNGGGTGTMAYRIADHLPLRNDMLLSMRMDMQMPADVSMQMDMTMKMDARGERYR